MRYLVIFIFVCTLSPVFALAQARAPDCGAPMFPAPGLGSARVQPPKPWIGIPVEHIEYDPNLSAIYGMNADSVLRFLLSHECGHLALNHLAAYAAGGLSPAVLQKMELDADWYAAKKLKGANLIGVLNTNIAIFHNIGLNLAGPLPYYPTGIQRAAALSAC